MSTKEDKGINFLTKEDSYQILLPGAFGALLVTWQDLSGADFSVSILFATLIAMLLGSIAALAFIVVIAGTDRTEVRKVIVLSILAGFSYQPVIDAARSNLNLNIEIANQQQEIAEQEATIEATTEALEFTRVLSSLNQQAIKDSDREESSEELMDAFEEFTESISILDEERQQEIVSGLVSNASVIAPNQQIPLTSLLEEAELISEDFSSAVSSNIPRCISDLDVVSPDGAYVEVANSDTGDTRCLIEITVPSSGFYQLSVFSMDTPVVDLVADLYSIFDGEVNELVAFNDDAEAFFTDPEINTSLEAGNYFLQVSGYLDASFDQVQVRLVETFTYTYDAVVLEIGETLNFDTVNATRASIPFSIDQEGTYTFSITSNNADDLVAEIFEANSDLLFAFDDDSGGDRNPQISVLLAPGDYYLNVNNFNETNRIESFSLVVSQIEL